MESTRRMERSWTRKMWSFGHVFYRREERRLAVLTEVCLSSLVLPVQCCHPARLLAPHAVPLGGHRLLLYSPLLHPPEGHRRVLRPLRLLHLLHLLSIVHPPAWLDVPPSILQTLLTNVPLSVNHALVVLNSAAEMGAHETIVLPRKVLPVEGSK